MNETSKYSELHLNRLEEAVILLLSKEIRLRNLSEFYPEYDFNKCETSILTNFIGLEVCSTSPFIRGVDTKNQIWLLETSTHLWLLLIIKKFFTSSQRIDDVIELITMSCSCQVIVLEKVFELMLILFSFLTLEELAEIEIAVLPPKMKSIFIENKKELLALLDSNASVSKLSLKQDSHFEVNETKISLTSAKRAANSTKGKVALTSSANKENTIHDQNRINTSKMSSNNSNYLSNNSVNFNSSQISGASSLILLNKHINHYAVIVSDYLGLGLFRIIKCNTLEAKQKCSNNDYAIIPIKQKFSFDDRKMIKNVIDELNQTYKDIAYIPYTQRDSIFDFTKP